MTKPERNFRFAMLSFGFIRNEIPFPFPFTLSVYINQNYCLEKKKGKELPFFFVFLLESETPFVNTNYVLIPKLGIDPANPNSLH